MIGPVRLGAGEYVWPDAFRCLPGFCLFSASLAGASFVYRIDSTTAAVLSKAAVPGVCAHMHVDFNSHNAFTLCVEASGRAVVTEVSGVTPVAVADVTAALAGGAVAPGQTTHCSAFQSMYIGVDHGGAGRDAVVTVDLRAGAVTGTTTLGAPVPLALWATCDGSGAVGGVSFAAGSAGGNGTATFGAFDAKGAYKVDSTVGVFAGLAPSGLLTGTSPASYQDAFVAAFYPAGTGTNDTSVSGALWAVDPYGGSADDFVTALDYMLIGAAWDREGRR